MDTVINDKLQPVEGYLISLVRNVSEGWYEIEVGIPSHWEVGDNDDVSCETVEEYGEKGKIMRISPKNSEVVVDHLILFLEIVIKTNVEIARKEKEFVEKIAQMKEQMKEEASELFKKLEEEQRKSFQSLRSGAKNEVAKKRGRGKKSETSKNKTASTNNKVSDELDNEGSPNKEEAKNTVTKSNDE